MTLAQRTIWRLTLLAIACTLFACLIGAANAQLELSPEVRGAYENRLTVPNALGAVAFVSEALVSFQAMTQVAREIQGAGPRINVWNINHTSVSTQAETFPRSVETIRGTILRQQYELAEARFALARLVEDGQADNREDAEGGPDIAAEVPGLAEAERDLKEAERALRRFLGAPNGQGAAQP